MTQANRKRGRTAEDEASEFTPLSKRINQLHINSFSGFPESSTDKMDSNWGNRNFIPSPNHSEPSQGSSSCDGYSCSNSLEYRPDLDATENPFYYERNKLLYNLHMERVQRISEPY